eukprot:m.138180 g.138180  ORF g.138180 m.138180 type:complete len:420 (-) comp29975_c0_seq1:17-1276(-)
MDQSDQSDVSATEMAKFFGKMTEEHSHFVSSSMACVLAAVFQDCTNQLAVLGSIVPVSKEITQDAIDSVLGEEVDEVVEDTRMLEKQYAKLIADRKALEACPVSKTFTLKERVAALAVNEAAVREVTSQIHKSTRVLVKNLRSNPGAAENIEKIQGERQQVQDLMESTCKELVDSMSFTTLASFVKEENESTYNIVERVRNADATKQRVADLLVELEEVRVDAEDEITSLDEEIAQLKDQLQETKARVALEGKYIKKEAGVRVSVSKKQQSAENAALSERIVSLRAQIAEEQNCSTDVCEFLEANFEKLTAEQEKWAEKYDTDNENKQKELDELKLNQKQDLASLKDLAAKYQDYDEICKDDRETREDARLEAQLAVRKLAAAIKVQAWWRGTMQRRPKKAAAKGKGKKGSKKGKKKKK